MWSYPRLRFALTLFCLGTIMLHLAVFWPARHNALAGWPDFSIFYTAGLMLRRGQGQALYSDDLQRQTQKGFIPGVLARRGPLPYNHPPFEALLYVPLTHLSYRGAYLVSLVLNLLLVAWCICLVRPWLPALRSMFPRLLFLAPLAFFPVVYALMQGQDSVLLLTVYCLVYVAFRRMRDIGGGACLGLGLFKFHLVLPFAFILLLRRRWRPLSGFFLSALVELALSWKIVGWKELAHYPLYVWQVNRSQPAGVIIPDNMPNLRGLFDGWSGPSLFLQVALFASSSCLLLWASRQWEPGELRDVKGWNSGFSLALIATFLVGYHSYSHDMAILLLPALITLDGLLQQQHSRRQSTFLSLMLGLIFLSPLYLVLTLYLSHQNLFALVLLGFAACLVASSATAALSASDRDPESASVQVG
jgi:hypothetical protein